jgi:Predicted membrane protein (DUF2207)
VLAAFLTVESPEAVVVILTAATLLWLLAVGVVYLRRRPNEPPVGPETLDLPPEPPAVANLLVHDFRVTRDAVPATLLDLAARGFVELEERGPGSYVCRLQQAPDGPVEPYERRVLELLRRRAHDGIVPAGALTTGPSAESSKWWKEFRSEVIADAQSRGLSQDILDGRTFKRLSSSLLVPTGLAALTWSFRVGLGAWVVGAFLLGAVRARHPQRDTPVGLAAASKWLGVRKRLAEDEAFQAQPPIAVALWERYLSYGAAFGVAPGAVRPIPMGAESDYRAWSSYGGRWRPVRIRYPDTLPPGWGKHPALALFQGLVAAAVAVFVLAVVARPVLDALPDSGALELLVGAALIVLPAVVGVFAAVAVLRALADLVSSRDVTGQILRLRIRGSGDDKRHYVAVDDGASPTIRAWLVKPELYAPLRQDQIVVASLTPHLRYVRSIRALAS